MKLLILYATTEGQTRKIAQFVGDKLTKRGHTVSVADAASPSAPPDPKAFDAAILAGSLHAGAYQAALVHYIQEHKAELQRMPTAFISVSLSAASDDTKDNDGLSQCWERFTTQTGWMPLELHQAAGAFRFTKYDFFKRWTMRLIAYQKGVTAAPDSDLELTDWSALETFADDFAVHAKSRLERK